MNWFNEKILLFYATLTHRFSVCLSRLKLSCNNRIVFEGAKLKGISFSHIIPCLIENNKMILNILTYQIVFFASLQKPPLSSILNMCIPLARII
jgi:hypothetical protein